MRIWKRSSAVLISAGLLIPATCFGAQGAVNLVEMIAGPILQEALDAFWGISAAAMFYYAIRMVLESSKEDVFKEMAHSFIYVFVGFCVIASARAFVTAFGIPGLIAPLALNDAVIGVADFLITMSAGIFVLILTIIGIHMISTQGDTSAFEKWRKVLIANVLGVILMFVSTFIIHAVSDIAPGLIVEEMRGLALFMLQIIGFVCVVALIVAGIMLIVSIDETLKDRAKRIIIGTLIALVILIICYTLIAYLVPVTIG